MKQSLRHSITTTLIALALTSTAVVHAADDLKTLQASSDAAIKNFTDTDAGLKAFFKNSAAYVILPSVGEGGFIIGGEHGKGLVYEKGALIGKSSLTVVSIGAQVGGGSFSEVVFFETPEAFKEFKTGKYTMNAQAKATVAASGVAANAKYTQGVLVFTLPKSGVMASAAIGGQKFTFEAIK
ncbi:MAG TPA: hypothetical protein PLX89_10070 [Verrucomicrobiota bacterium]|nr:hypothetical protein [Verrucomicrobiales bacterium]HRI13342.1 hypothetical protein [Verrucomicrobiota bacterium]